MRTPYGGVGRPPVTKLPSSTLACELGTIVLQLLHDSSGEVPDPSLAEPRIEFTYTANGQRETMRDATGTTIYSYDGRGQLSTKQTPFGTMSCSYYANGSLALDDCNARSANASMGNRHHAARRSTDRSTKVLQWPFEHSERSA